MTEDVVVQPVWPRPEPEPSLDLDAYRDGRGVLRAEGQLVGYAMTRVQLWWTLKGRGRRRQGDAPTEKLEWYVEYVRSDPRDHSDGWDDGVEDDTPAILRLWNQGVFRLPHGELVTVEWLTGDAADRVRETLSWPADVTDLL